MPPVILKKVAVGRFLRILCRPEENHVLIKMCEPWQLGRIAAMADGDGAARGRRLCRVVRNTEHAEAVGERNPPIAPVI